jgi:hypothetical protein
MSHVTDDSEKRYRTGDEAENSRDQGSRSSQIKGRAIGDKKNSL